MQQYQIDQVYSQAAELQNCLAKCMPTVFNELSFTFAICRRRSVCLVCNLRAPYSGYWNLLQCFYAIWYLSHLWRFDKNFMEIVPGEPHSGGTPPARTVASSKAARGTRLPPGGHEDRSAKGARIEAPRGGEGVSPSPTDGGPGGAGSGAEPPLPMHFWHIWGPQNSP